MARSFTRYPIGKQTFRENRTSILAILLPLITAPHLKIQTMMYNGNEKSGSSCLLKHYICIFFSHPTDTQVRDLSIRVSGLCDECDDSDEQQI